MPIKHQQMLQGPADAMEKVKMCLLPASTLKRTKRPLSGNEQEHQEIYKTHMIDAMRSY